MDDHQAGVSVRIPAWRAPYVRHFDACRLANRVADVHARLLYSAARRIVSLDLRREKRLSMGLFFV